MYTPIVSKSCTINDCITVKSAPKYTRHYSGKISKNYYTRSEEYLKARNRTHLQNQFGYLISGNSDAKPGSENATNNKYRNTVNNKNCSNVSNNPINHKYAVQGPVSNSLRLERVKRDTFRDYYSEINMNKKPTTNTCCVGGTSSDLRVQNLKRHLYKR